jgi:hypothetical protein
MQFSSNQRLYLQGGLGRFHRITAIFSDPFSANAYLSSSPSESVLAVLDPFIFLAESSDLGLPYPLPAPLPSTLRSLIESARTFLAEGDVAANRVEADHRLVEALSALRSSYPQPISSSSI